MFLHLVGNIYTPEYPLYGGLHIFSFTVRSTQLFIVKNLTPGVNLAKKLKYIEAFCPRGSQFTVEKKSDLSFLFWHYL